jgi:hypothetical protein
MIVNCFTVIMASQFYETTLKVITNEFGKNIPSSLPYEGGPLGFITHLFCVDANVNVEKIVKDNNCKMTNLYKMEIDDDKYNNKYIICNTYKKEGAPFCLKIFQKV